MDIIKPKRRLCPDKKIRFEITQMNPFDWLSKRDDRHVFNEIDGYIISNSKINGIFIKYEAESLAEKMTNELAKELVDLNESALKLAELFKCPFRIFVWPVDYPENKDLAGLDIFSINENLEIKTISLNDLEQGIEKLRGYNFSKPKNLLTANSYVECYLANHTKNPWPGDLDGLLYDKQKGLFVSLVEFKTHNIDSPTKDEYIGKYSQQDWRRFDVLFNLQEEIESKQKYKPKLYYIVWGTKEIENHKYIKIDTLEQGKVIDTKLILRPRFGEFSNELFAAINPLQNEATI